MKGQLHPYQAEALLEVRRHLARHRSTLVVIPTGGGKTVLFAATAEQARKRGRVLVLAHRQELVDQAAEKIERFTDLRCGIEMGDRTMHGRVQGLPDVVVASVQTLAREQRRHAFPRDSFFLIVVDEAHHAPAEQYREVLSYFESAKVLGVTATPDRADGIAMGEVFESVAYVVEIRDLIEQGFLVPIRQRTVQVEHLDLSQVRVSRETGDLSEKDLEAVLMDERVLHEMAVPTLELAGDRPTIVFTASVEHAHALAGVLNRYPGGQAAAVDGTTPREERRRIIGDFSAGRIRQLLNCAVLTEGFDAPATSCVAVARPTKSRALYSQMVGRGTRTSPLTGKSDCLVLDLVGNAGKHSLVNALDILDGNEDQEVRKRAAKKAASGEVDVLEALEQAEIEIAEEKRSLVTARARYKAADVDPFTVLGASDRSGRWGGIGPTPRQLELLEQTGIKVDPDAIDRGQASALLDKVFSRRKQGLCTYKQAAALAKRGLNPDVSFDDARRAMDAIAANGWRTPPWLFEDPVLRPRAVAAEVA